MFKTIFNLFSIVSVTSTKINATEEDKHSTEEGAEDDVEVIAERIIKISEVTSEVTCDYGDVHDGGRNGHSNQKGVEHSAVPCEFEVSVILKDQMGHVGHGTGQHQVTVKSALI